LITDTREDAMNTEEIDDLVKQLKSDNASVRSTAIEQIRRDRIEHPRITSELFAIERNDPNEIPRKAARKTIEELGLEEKEIIIKWDQETDGEIEVHTPTDRLLVEILKGQGKIRDDLWEQVRLQKSISSELNILKILVAIILIILTFAILS
jgi:hypothetical protein